MSPGLAGPSWLGEGYADVLADHQCLLRGAFERHGGQEIDTQGDSLFVAFSRAKDAVAAAVEAQRELAGAATRMVERGLADAALYSPPPAERLADIATRLPSQLHATPSAQTYYLWLNTRVPPFDARLRSLHQKL